MGFFSVSVLVIKIIISTNNNNNDMKFIVLNVGSLISRAKKVALADFLSENQPDVAFICETRLTENSRLSLQNYGILRSNKLQGTAIIYKNKYKLLDLIMNFNTISVTAAGIYMRGQDERERKILLISAYFPPIVTSVDDIKELLDKINSLYCDGGYEAVIMGGDLNAKHYDWCNSMSNTSGKALSEWLENNEQSSDLRIVHPGGVTFPKSKACIDFFITTGNIINELDTNYTCSTLASFSDHYGVRLQIDLSSYSPELRSPPVYRSFKNTNWKQFSLDMDREFELVRLEESRNLSNEEIDNAIEDFNKIIHLVSNNHSRVVRNNHSYYKLPNDIQDLFNIRKNWKRDLKRCLRRNGNRWNQETKEFQKRIQLLSVMVDRRVNAHFNAEFQDRLKTLKPGPSVFKEINRMVGKSKKNKISRVMKDSIQYTGTKEILGIFQSFYKDLYSERVPQSDQGHSNEVIRTVDDYKRDIPEVLVEFSSDKKSGGSELDNPFVSSKTIKSHLKVINRKKSSGPDGITNFILKKISNKAVEFLQVIFNNCLNNGYFPRSWKVAKLIPIQKSKDSCEVGNFRPISLLSNAGKLLERVIASEFDEFCEVNKEIPDMQFGFKRGHSTEHALLKIHNEVTKGLRNRQATVMCSLDIKKAFDSVWVKGLIYKLIKAKIPLYILRMIVSFFDSRRLCIFIDEEKSDEIELASGVPQGSIFGPKLYNFYLGDFPHTVVYDPDGLEESSAILYADDTGILASDKDPKRALRMVESHLAEVDNFYKLWGIEINSAKSSLICFRNASGKGHRDTVTKSNELKLRLNNVEIPLKKEIKYLGIGFNNLFKFNEHVKRSLDKARKAFNIMSPLIHCKKKLHVRTKLLIYKQLIRPILTYGFPCWFSVSTTWANKMEQFERKTLRHCISKKFKTRNRYYSNREVYEEAGIDPLMTYILNLWGKRIGKLEVHDNLTIRNIYDENINDSLSDCFYLSAFSLANENTRTPVENKKNIIEFYNGRDAFHHRG